MKMYSKNFLEKNEYIFCNFVDFEQVWAGDFKLGLSYPMLW